jgi:hypothetical protein
MEVETGLTAAKKTIHHDTGAGESAAHQATERS